jgi:hypothetical protein
MLVRRFEGFRRIQTRRLFSSASASAAHKTAPSLFEDAFSRDALQQKTLITAEIPERIQISGWLCRSVRRIHGPFFHMIGW